jgi:hypothetical protein
MRNAVRTYQRHIDTALKRFATWLPGDQLAVGDVGVVSRGSFRKETDLDELGLPFDRRPGDPRPHLSATSVSTTRSGGDLDVEAAGVAESSLELSFATAGLAVFEARGVVHERIGNVDSLARQIRELDTRGGWERRWLVVDEVWKVECATIIVATENETTVRIHAETGAVRGLDGLADPRLGLRVEIRSGNVVKEIGSQNVTPLYLCRRLRFSKLKPVRRPPDGSPDVASEPSAQFVVPPCEDLLINSWS